MAYRFKFTNYCWKDARDVRRGNKPRLTRLFLKYAHKKVKVRNKSAVNKWFGRLVRTTPRYFAKLKSPTNR